MRSTESEPPSELEPPPKEEKQPPPETESPSEEERLLDAREAVKDLVSQRLKAKKGPIEVLWQLVEAAHEDKIKNPMSSRAALEEAARLAGIHGKPVLAIQLIDELGSQLPAAALLSLKTEVLKLEPESRSKESELAAVDALLCVAESAMAQDDYEVAEGLCDLAKKRASAVRPIENASYLLAQELGGQVRTVRSEYKKLGKAFEALRVGAADEKVMEQVGEFLCCVKRDWKAGATYLRRVKELPVHSAEIHDLGRSLSGEDEIHIGDEWWKLSEKAGSVQKRAYRQEAAYWYLRGMRDLQGLEKERHRGLIERRTKMVFDGDPRARLEALLEDAALVLTFDWTTYQESRDNIGLIDLSGRKNDGLVFGAEIVLGRAGAALKFDGNDARVVSKEGVRLPSGDVPLSISAWVKAPGPAGYAQMIVAIGCAGNGERIAHLRLGEGHEARFGLPENPTCRGDKALSDNQWHHICGVYDGPATRDYRLYVDGRHVDTQQVTRAVQVDQDRWMVGQLFSGNLKFEGCVDEVAVFDVALSPLEVEWLYRWGSDGRSLQPLCRR
ncbi:MAG: LamG domain-containing protein [Armatimonadetes bacterium]|nr:LamG domain-containing protein [Armatimonadota bacterium]